MEKFEGYDDSDTLDLEDRLAEILDEDPVNLEDEKDICPKCGGYGCNYCLMLSY